VVAVLEYRAGVRAAPEIAAEMAKELTQLTSHRAVSPDQARLRLGPSLDAEVARCKGNPACISALGGRLECDEVILIGVSQLGDLILAIQRIDVQSGRVVSRLADSLGPRQRIRSSNLQGYLRRLLPAVDFRRYGRIVVRTEHVGDQVFLDEAPRGHTPLAPLVLSAPGRYTLRVSRPGYEDFVARLDVLPEATVEVTPTLTRQVTPPKWYQHWWVWTLAGGAVAAAATAAVVVGTRGQDVVPAVVRLPP
jgi:hypothetical protein